MSKTAKIVMWVVVIVLVIWGLSSMGKKSDIEAGTVKIGFLDP